MRAKWTGGVAQAEQQLFYKDEALNSKLSPTKRKKKRRTI
jgi:hypothetical protein